MKQVKVNGEMVSVGVGVSKVQPEVYLLPLGILYDLQVQLFNECNYTH